MIRGIFSPPDPRSTAEYRELVEWYDSKDFGEVGDGGQRLLEQARIEAADADKTRDRLDAKAERLFLLGSGLAALVISRDQHVQIAAGWTISGLVFLLCSMLLAIRAWSPSIRGAPPKMRDLFESEREAQRPAMVLAAALALSNTGNRIVSRWKARAVKLAIIALTMAVAIFAGGYCVALLSR